MPEPGGIPAENRICLATVHTPAQPAGKREPRPRLGRTGHPAEPRDPVIERCLNVRPEVECEADIVAAALDLIDDLDGPAEPVQPLSPGGFSGFRCCATRSMRTVRRSSSSGRLK